MKVSTESFVVDMFRRLGRQEKIKVEIEKKWKHIGRIRRVDGTYTYFRGTSFDLNGLGARQIAKDKAYCSQFLAQTGYSVIAGKEFCSPDWAKAIHSKNSIAEAYVYARDVLGFPVVVKPNSLTQGKLVCVAQNKRTFLQAVEKICVVDRIFLVQELVGWRDYRVLVLDDEVLSVYERLPLCVTGDGKSDIDELLDKKQQEFVLSRRGKVLDKRDFRIDERLMRFALSRESILADGEVFALLDNKNLSTGGNSVDVTSTIHGSFRDLAVKMVKDMGLRYCGVDLFIEGDICEKLDARKNRYKVIELNAAPGVDNYARSGAEQMKIVEGVYRKILRKLAGVEPLEKKISS